MNTGHLVTPPACVADFLDICIKLGSLSFHLVHSHLMMMLYQIHTTSGTLELVFKSHPDREKGFQQPQVHVIRVSILGAKKHLSRGVTACEVNFSRAKKGFSRSILHSRYPSIDPTSTQHLTTVCRYLPLP